MSYRDNAAGRLHQFLESALKTPQRHSALQGWGEVLLYTKNPDPLQLLRHGMQLMEMAAHVKRTVRRHDAENAEAILRHFAEVDAVVARFPLLVTEGPTMRKFMSGLGRDGLYSLELAEGVLRRHAPERVVDDARMNDLTEMVIALKRELTNADDLDDEVKTFVIGHLDAVYDALTDVRRFGPGRLNAEVGAMIGSFVTKRSLWKRLSDQKVIAVVTFLTAVDALLGIADFALGERDDPRIIINVYNSATGCDVPALPPGPTIVPIGTADDEIHDAEIVDDVGPSAAG